MIPKNLASLFWDTARRFPKKTALLFKEEGRYTKISWEALSKEVGATASFFIQKGIKPGDKIAILSENRPEWVVVDLAAQTIGAVTVPIYSLLTPAEIRYLLQDSQAIWVAVSNLAQLEKIIAIEEALPGVLGILGFETSLSLARERCKTPLYLIKEAQKTDIHLPTLENLRQSVNGDSPASIIYTSGTTGQPKGVVLTHLNFLHNVAACRAALPMDSSEIHLSFLPLSHVFERTAGYYLMIFIGATIAYAENMDTVPQNLLEVRPTFILGVPRFYEKIKERVMTAVDRASAVKKGLFFWAKSLEPKKRRGLGGLLAAWLVYGKFKKHLGGRLRFCVSGGAALAKETAEFFYDLGVMIYEGYGLTETSPVITANRQGQFKFGTVGLPVEGVQVKLSEEGEILTKSACVMKEYYGKPQETQAVLKDGWFYTGDLGSFDKEGFLTITGRKKELIVTSGGKKVAPKAIEEAVERDPFILRCVLFGEGKKFITALIIPRQEKIIEYAESQKIAYRGYAELLKNPQIYQLIQERIEKQCEDLASFERIKYFALLERDFSQEAGEITPTLKVKRSVVISRYQDRLLPLYEHDNHSR
jgi:long-chain acyl-CoA synthetase